MSSRSSRNTRGRIIAAAWELFYERGYDDTTVEEIIERSGTSRGSFYHYFDGKDALLSSLSYLFDEEYARLQTELDPELDSWEKLLRLNAALFSQLVTRGDKHLLNRERLYFKYLRQIVREGQERGQLRRDMTVSEIVKLYALAERALMYDWCLCGGEYSLSQYSARVLPMFLREIRT